MLILTGKPGIYRLFNDSPVKHRDGSFLKENAICRNDTRQFVTSRMFNGQ